MNKRLSKEIKDEVRRMYATREFSMNEVAGHLGISVSAVSRIVSDMEKPKKKTETEKRTEVINAHIMEFFADTNELIETIKANMYGDRTVRQACNDVVQGGCLLVYYNTVNDFLKEIGCKVSTSDNTNWSMYKKLIVNRMEKIYEENTK